MDAFDIFRKLRTGAKFNSYVRKKPDVVNNQDATPARTLTKVIIPKRKSNDGKTQNSDDDDKGSSPSKKIRGTSSLEIDSDDSFHLMSTSMADGRKKRRKVKKMTSEEVTLKRMQEVDRCRNDHKIHVWGEDIPDPVTSFELLAAPAYRVHRDLLNSIAELGFPAPTPIQMQAIPVMLQGREILGCAPTGSGKTAAFLIPIIHQLSGPQKLGFRAVIVEPTRELAKQVYRECCRLGASRRLRTHMIDKIGLAKRKFGPKSSQRFDILITTPNRLVFLLEGDRPMIQLNNVEWLVVDESDKLFETGKQGFRDQLAVIYKACSSPNVRHAMFSATFAQDVEEWCNLNLDNCVTISIGERNSAADTVEQKLVFVGSESGKLVAFRDLVKKGLTPPVLVFVQTKERAQELFSELIYDGINVDVIHADRTQMQRDNVVKAFRAGKIWVLICTELMGRGIDFKGVNLVVNYDFPPSAVSYIHRIGRTGRAGRHGSAITFFTESDFVNLKSIAQVMRAANCNIPDYMLKLNEPKKEVQERLVKRGVKRKSISTKPLYDLEQEQKQKDRWRKKTEKNLQEENEKEFTRRKRKRIYKKKTKKNLQEENENSRMKNK